MLHVGTSLEKMLSRAISRGRLSHALLLVGNDLTVLEQTARQVASWLNCEHPSSPNWGCGECRPCARIQKDNHPDVITILSDAEAVSRGIAAEGSSRDIRIAQVREINSAAQRGPFEAKSRVFIIVQAERMNDFAANALLKTLEEPKPHVLFFVLTGNDRRLLPTIRSRCTRVPIPSVNPATATVRTTDGVGCARAILVAWSTSETTVKIQTLAETSTDRREWALAFSFIDDLFRQVMRSSVEEHKGIELATLEELASLVVAARDDVEKNGNVRLVVERLALRSVAPGLVDKLLRAADM